MTQQESDEEFASILALARKAKVIIRVRGSETHPVVTLEDKPKRFWNSRIRRWTIYGRGKAVGGIELRKRFVQLKKKGEIEQ